MKYGRYVDSSHGCHNRDHETPLTLYVALKIHVVTRKRNSLMQLFNLEMCVSYSHLLQLISDLGNRVCDLFTLDGNVCPPKMCNGLFTVAAADNMDYFMNFSHAASFS